MIEKKHIRELFFFGLSGMTAFLVDGGVLYLLKPYLGLYVGRIVSFLCAVFTTWLINRNLTFKERFSGITLHREFLGYLSLMIMGGICNLTLYSWLVTHFELFSRHPIFAVACGSLAGMGINWSTSRFLLFKKKK